MPKLNSEFMVFYGGEFDSHIMGIAKFQELAVIFGKDPYVKFGDFYIKREGTPYYLLQNTKAGPRVVAMFSKDEKLELWKYELKNESRCSIQ